MPDVSKQPAVTRSRRLGRRPGPTSSRADVLAAAARLFAAEGYTATTIRGIAEAARVDSALVVRFYGGKEQLFAAVLENLEASLPGLQSVVLYPDRAERERHLVEAYFGVWESAVTGDAARALVRGAVGAPRATKMVRELLERQMFSTPAQPEMALTMATLFGIAVSRYILRVGPLAQMTLDELVNRVVDHMRIP